jgi:hypothetical protein
MIRRGKNRAHSKIFFDKNEKTPSHKPQSTKLNKK